MVGFGTSGIRDLSPFPVSPDLARRLGLVLGASHENGLSEMGAGASPTAGAPRTSSSRPQSPLPISIGFDGRRSGPMLKSALASGALQAGAAVHDLGLCATPTLALHAQKTGGWGVMVTASHNPPEYNGLKVFFAGREVPDAWEREIEKQLEALQSRFSKNTVSWSSAGCLSDSSSSARAAHLSLALSLAPLALIRKTRPRVVVDCGNAAACALMPDLMRAAGCEVLVLNGTAGEPYGRVLEPKKESLGALSRAVRKSRADLGIAHDGDADRAIVLDERGRMAGLDTQLAMVVSDQLDLARSKKPNAPLSIVSTVESGLSLREACAAAQARLIITPVGSRYVAAEMRRAGALFGGEPCGEYVFSRGALVPDGLACGLYFAGLFARRGKLSALADAVPAYPMAREKIHCAGERKQKAMALIEKDWPFFKPSRVDGLRSDLDDGWVLVRPSGTEPAIRITMEGRSKKELAARMEAVRAVVSRAVQKA
ncbi:putative phosphoglucosamine mutase [uncultured archaeon]|nr:putative phosphoglucosamine mutase [uncultured archaeon]